MKRFFWRLHAGPTAKSNPVRTFEPQKGADLNQYYILGQLLEIIDVVLGILGSVLVGYGFLYKPRMAETGQTGIPSNPRWSTPKTSSQKLKQFGTIR